ncbi:MAG TPA: serine hydrolase [Candidatus Acidoferrales bacterium]|nr:serine hydrolase [Candidatus Acidoferrales bacterium]
MLRCSKLRFTVPLLLMLLGAGAIAQQNQKRSSEVERQRGWRSQVNTTNWDDGGALSRWVYLNSTEVFPSCPVERAGAVRPLPVRLRPEIGDFVVDRGKRDVTLREWIHSGTPDGFIILSKGAVVYEEYPQMQRTDVHLSFSVTKAFVGTVLGILESEGRIDLDVPIERYLPELSRTEWAGTHVRDIADMASGMEGAEDSFAAYSDPMNKHFQMEAAMGWQPRSAAMPESVRAGETYAYVHTLKRVREAGKEQVYTSANTELLTELIERLTDKPLCQVISEKIWSKIGAENDAYLLTNEKGFPIAHGGMGMTLRDLARFGLFFTPTGHNSDAEGAPATFVRNLLEKGRPELAKGKRPAWFSHSSYQWDGVSKYGQIFKGGFAGQILFVDCKKDVVIAYFGTNPNSDTPPTPLPLVALVQRYF